MRKVLYAVLIGTTVLAGCSTLYPAAEAETARIAASESSKQDIRSTNYLISILIDSADLYAEAAEIVDDDAYRIELIRLKNARREMARDLQSKVTGMGGKPDKHGEITGTASRTFLKLRETFSNDNEAAIAESVRSETFLLSEFEHRAKDEALKSSTRQMLLQQIAILKDQSSTLLKYKEDVEKRLYK